MSDNIFNAGPQIYRFEFGSDEKIYSTQFMGEKIPKGADIGILKEVRKHLLEESSGIIWSYLVHNHIDYFNFTSGIKVLEHDRIMKQADFLLHSHSCRMMDEYLKETTFYYASVDYQKNFISSLCKGCYYVIKKVPNALNRIPHYRIIGQTYEDNAETSQGYFAIRENRNTRLLFDITKASGELVFPSFGCVDTLNLLMGIDNIKAIKQAKEAAIR